MKSQVEWMKINVSAGFNWVLVLNVFDKPRAD